MWENTLLSLGLGIRGILIYFKEPKPQGVGSVELTALFWVLNLMPILSKEDSRCLKKNRPVSHCLSFTSYTILRVSQPQMVYIYFNMECMGHEIVSYDM